MTKKRASRNNMAAQALVIPVSVEKKFPFKIAVKPCCICRMRDHMVIISMKTIGIMVIRGFLPVFHNQTEIARSVRLAKS